MISEDTLEGLRRITVRNGECEISLLPELGGKLIALRFLDGPNALLSPPDFPYRRAEPFAPFDQFDTSGFDDCFPTVAECEDPDDPGRTLPDHGELWSRAHEVELHADGLGVTTSIRLQSWPGRFVRSLRLQGHVVQLRYQVHNDGDRTRHVLWSAHPLLEASEGSRILLPGTVTHVRVESSAGNRLGKKGAKVPWQGLETTGPKSLGYADKLFAGPLRVGRAAFWNRAHDQTVGYAFSATENPWVGLWICQGGWPTSRASKHYTVAVEPCGSPHDSLAEAAGVGECATAPAHGTVSWSMDVSLFRGMPPDGWLSAT